MASTIRELAKAADVSAATVWRALNTPQAVAEPTRTRVVEVARRMGYSPSRGVRAMPGHTGFVGAVVPDLANPFFPAVLSGVRAVARPFGRHVLAMDAAEDPAAEAELVVMALRQVDALVLVSPRLAAEHLVALIGTRRAVVVNRLVPGLPAVLLDVADGARQLVRHLTALGHRAVGYAGGPRASFADAERRRALTRCCRAGGLRAVDLGAHPPYFASGERVADRALRSGVTAVVAFNDLMALGTIAGLRERGVQVPEGVSVAGFDDIPMAGLATPRLTTIAPPLGQAGRVAMALLDAPDPVPGGPRRWPVLPVRLVVGGSTAPPRRAAA